MKERSCNSHSRRRFFFVTSRCQWRSARHLAVPPATILASALYRKVRSGMMRPNKSSPIVWTRRLQDSSSPQKNGISGRLFLLT